MSQSSPKMPLRLFCVGHLLLGTGFETPWEKTSFFSVDGCPLKLASGLGIGSAYFRRTTRKEAKILNKPREH